MHYATKKQIWASAWQNLGIYKWKWKRADPPTLCKGYGRFSAFFASESNFPVFCLPFKNGFYSFRVESNWLERQKTFLTELPPLWVYSFSSSKLCVCSRSCQLSWGFLTFQSCQNMPLNLWDFYFTQMTLNSCHKLQAGMPEKHLTDYFSRPQWAVITLTYLCIKMQHFIDLETAFIKW